MSVPQSMVEEIRRRLRAIEIEEQVVILLAVESGSRAWGFASADSDFDVRFVYARPVEAYLSVKPAHRDVIERPIVDDLDINGWDIKKALGLFMKSNPPLLEWLQCPMVYQQTGDFADRLRNLMSAYYSPAASFQHYLHMARGNYREYLRGESVWRKKYFYVLRPLLATRWIRDGRGPVPIVFQTLVDTTVQEPALRQAIDNLLAEKRQGAELDYGPADPVLGAFIDAELALLENASEGKDPTPSTVAIDDLFRETLHSIRVPS